MTLPESRPFGVDLTFLVSREGIVTLSADLGLAPMDRLRAPDPAPGGKFRRTMRPADHGPGLMDTMSDWAEVEMAAKAKDAVALLGIARRLAADAFLRQAADASAGCKAVIASETEVPAIPGGMAAIDAFTRVSRGCLDQVSANAQLLRRSGNAEALHQCRVGLRRLRAALTAFRQILPREDLERWKSETKWLAGELDAARELDAFIEYVSGSTNAPIQGDPVLAAFGARLILAKAMAYDAAVAAVDSPRFAALVLDFTKWVEAAPWPRDDDPKAARRAKGDASVLAARALKRLDGRLRKAGKHLGKLDSAGRHEVRIKAKKLRYAAEFFSETFGKSARKRHKKFIAPLTGLLNILGELNDMATTGPCARAVVGRSADLAFRAGEIVGRRKGDEPRLLARAVRAYEQCSDAKRFWA